MPTNRPTIEAAFPHESYAPGDVARVVIWTSGSSVSLQVFPAGTETENVRARDLMLVTPGRDAEMTYYELSNGAKVF